MSFDLRSLSVTGIEETAVKTALFILTCNGLIRMIGIDVMAMIGELREKRVKSGGAKNA